MSKVVVGMSGGVDSSVAAYLLKEAGHDVVGITMRTWELEDFEPGRIIMKDACAAADYLGIPHYVIDYHKEFKHNVIDYFVNEYSNGRTPNPCVVCNRYVKWEALLDAAKIFNADYAATGHYAVVEELENKRFGLRCAKTMKKDQTYALYNLSQEQLSKTWMPLGSYDKEAIRAIAAQIGLSVADKPDSQENCFIPDGDYAGYICRYTGRDSLEGNFISTEGRVLGRHKGIIHYTIGQRKGLGIVFGFPAFVTQIRPEANEVVIGTGEEIFTDILYADKLNYVSLPKFDEGMALAAKIRYNHSGAPCKVYMEGNDTVKCVFDEPVRAATPGQAVVFYKGSYVAGGGIIKSYFNK